MSGKPEDKERTAEIERGKQAQLEDDLKAADCPYVPGKPVSTRFSPLRFDVGPNQWQRRIFDSLTLEAQQNLAQSLIEEMRNNINHAVYGFEQKTGLVVDSLSIGREVAFCGFPQPVINASACSVEEFKKTDAYRDARNRNSDRIFSRGMF